MKKDKESYVSQMTDDECFESLKDSPPTHMKKIIYKKCKFCLTGRTAVKEYICGSCSVKLTTLNCHHEKSDIPVNILSTVPDKNSTGGFGTIVTGQAFICRHCGAFIK